LEYLNARQTESNLKIDQMKMLVEHALTKANDASDKMDKFNSTYLAKLLKVKILLIINFLRMWMIQ
jgi:hypothetical protein